MADPHHGDEKPGWADTKTFRMAFLALLVIAALAAAVAGFLPAFKNDHPHFDVESMGAFFAVYGFAAFSFIVLAGQHLRKLVGRKETYYEERE
ncbi:MAG: hypothetical protein AAB227_06570 [Pseudomonadota bacterium]